MTIHVHNLKGCAPTPLAHYLKGLGILRLVSEQKDPDARGWWRDESFHLATVLDEEALQRFFLEEYRPTALVGPWGARSGFFPGSSESAARKALKRIEASDEMRLGPFRETIVEVRTILGELGHSDKPTREEDRLRLLRELRKPLRSEIVAWIDVCVVLTDDAKSTPGLLGTGGNEGSGSYFSNFAQSVIQCLLDRKHDRRLMEALYSSPYPERGGGPAPGHFLPFAAAPANGGNGFWGSAEMNPWDLILCLEGTPLFAASAVRRLHATGLPHAAAPFAVRSSAVGYGSSVDGEKNRGEQWFPLWESPATLTELGGLIAEGRSQIGRRSAGRPIDFGRAVARLGFARGITAFHRYGYIERHGRNYIAVPLGRWPVRTQPYQDLIDEIAGWVDALRRASSGRQSPASIASAVRVCEEAILACCRDGRNPQRWQDLLIALGRAEAHLPRTPRFTAEKGIRPLPRLSSGWLRAADDGSAELRLALAFASQHGLTAEGEIDWKHPVRRHFLPLDSTNRRFAIQGEALASSTEIVCQSDDFETIALALLRRRIVEAGQRGVPQLPLTGISGAEASLHEVALFLAGEVDERKVLDLARPLMSLDWSRFRRPFDRTRGMSGVAGSQGFYGLVRLAYWPRPLRPKAGAEEVLIPLDPAILARLIAGDLVRASTTAIRRLSGAGFRPHLRLIAGDATLARRVASALVFPIRERDALTLADRLTRPALEGFSTPEEGSELNLSF